MSPYSKVQEIHSKKQPKHTQTTYRTSNVHIVSNSCDTFGSPSHSMTQCKSLPNFLQVSLRLPGTFHLYLHLPKSGYEKNVKSVLKASSELEHKKQAPSPPPPHGARLHTNVPTNKSRAHVRAQAEKHEFLMNGALRASSRAPRTKKVRSSSSYARITTQLKPGCLPTTLKRT